MYNLSKKMKSLYRSISFNLIYFMYLNGMEWIFIYLLTTTTTKNFLRKSYEMTLYQYFHIYSLAHMEKIALD